MDESIQNIYRRSLEHLDYVAESRGPFESAKRTPERLVSAIWFDQQIDQDHIQIVEGQRIEVISPGRWNQGPGPDFVGAEIRLDGQETLQGDIEVEVFASDWRKHGHSSNPDYDNVILIVCMWNDRAEGQESSIPILELFPFLAENQWPTLKMAADYPYISKTMRGRCTSVIEHRRLEQTLNFIAAAGDNRLEQKISRMAALSRTFGVDQTLYKGLMEAAGYASNKEPMSRLADTIHLEIIRSSTAGLPPERKQKVILALLYGSSGFFDRVGETSNAAYLSELKEIWQELDNEISLPRLEGFRLANVRPGNSPFRRMAAVSHFLADIDGLRLLDRIIESLGSVDSTSEKDVKAAVRNLSGSLTGLSDNFWDKRFSPHGASQARPVKLIGNGLAVIIIANIFIPLLLAHARQREENKLEFFVHEMFCRLGSLPHNSITRFTCARLFGPENLQPSFAKNARLHQGLIQIYYDFCQSLRKDCPDCEFIEFLES